MTQPIPDLPHEAHHYKTYRTRWLFLFNVALINSGCFMTLYALDVVANESTEYYDVDSDKLDLMNLSPWIIYIFGLFFGIFVIERFELLLSLRVAATVTAVGSVVRVLSTFPPYKDSLPRETQFWLTYAGQVIISLGHPIVMTMSTKTSQTWFPEAERPISTAVLGLASLIGGLLAQPLAPAIVNKDPEMIPYLNICFAVPVLCGCAITWIFVRSDGPPTPPSRSSALLLHKQKLNSREQLHKIGLDIITLLSSKTCLVLGLVQGAGVGMTNILMSQLTQLMCSKNYTQKESSLAAMLAIIPGFVGAFSIGTLARKTGRQQEFGKGGYGVAAIATVGFVVALGYPDMFSVIAVCMSVYGFFGVAAFPINLELILEHTFPMDAVMGECWIHTWGQIFSVAIVVAGNNLYNDLPAGAEHSCEGFDARDYTPYYYLIMGLTTVAALSLLLFANPQMKRTLKDHEDDDDSPLASGKRTISGGPIVV